MKIKPKRKELRTPRHDSTRGRTARAKTLERDGSRKLKRCRARRYREDYEPMGHGMLSTWYDAERFLFAGNATFTLVHKASATRFTYKVQRKKDGSPMWFIKLLCGPDNTSNYRYVGLLTRDAAAPWGVKTTRASLISATAQSVVVLQTFVSRNSDERVWQDFEMWHAGKCCRCGRKLTVPSSIVDGIGPECRGQL